MCMPLSYVGFTTVILGLPIIVWLGMLLLSLLLIQVIIAFLNLRMKITAIPFSVHRVLGYIILIIALIHAFLGLAAYLP